MLKKNPDAWAARSKSSRENTIPCETIMESGQFRYRYLPHWARIPEKLRNCRCRSVCCSDDGTVYALFQDPASPIAVFSENGEFIRYAGTELGLERPHFLSVHKDRLLITDSGTHTVLVTDPEGNLVRTVGTPGKPADTGFDESLGENRIAYLTAVRPAEGFNRPTAAVFAANGDILVSDGYGNCALHRYSPEGRHLWTVGGLGQCPGEFMLPHGLSEDAAGRIWVCDRENDRVQVFGAEGKYLGEIPGLMNPCGIWTGPSFVYIAESDRRLSIYSFMDPEAVMKSGAAVLSGSMPEIRLEAELGYLASPYRFHSVCENRRGDLFAAEFSDFQIVKLEKI